MCHRQLYLCLHVAQEMIQRTLGQFSRYISVNDGYTCKIKDINVTSEGFVTRLCLKSAMWPKRGN